MTLSIESGLGQLRADTAVESVEPAVAAASHPLRLQFNEPLPDALLAAVSDTLRRHPDVELRAYGLEVDPNLGWLSGLEHIERLALELWHATSFDVLAGFRNLRSLVIGETASKRPSLAFLRELPELEVLSLEGHDKDFDAVGDVRSLRRLHLRVPRVKTLEALRGHEGLEVLTIDFGGIRDLDPLAELPCLRGLELFQMRGLDHEDLAPLGDCAALEAISLGALRNVESLRVLAGRPRATLRFLILERLSGLASLGELGELERIEQLGLYESRPEDRRVDVLLRCATLRQLVVADVYPKEQFERLRKEFTGDVLILRGEAVRGALADVGVKWRAPVHELLSR